MSDPRVRAIECGECGMPCFPAEYHPYAACLMFKQCHNAETVRAKLVIPPTAPPALVWTDRKPTEAGAYWYRRDSLQDPIVLNVRMFNGDWWVPHYDALYNGGQWCGPLPRPGEGE